MIIDLILDRKAGDNYQPDHFYRECMEYSSIFDGIGADICEAMDYGTEDDVRKALCAYVTSNDYNPAICDYINSVSWLEESDDPEVSDRVERILHPERFSQEAGGPVTPDEIDTMVDEIVSKTTSSDTIGRFKHHVSWVVEAHGCYARMDLSEQEKLWDDLAIRALLRAPYPTL